jgi:tRNA 2-thiocytidine biosynthesis protein TtcA
LEDFLLLPDCTCTFLANRQEPAVFIKKGWISRGYEEMRDFKSSLYRKIGLAIKDYEMIEEGDRILVALSGGKDSFTLLDTLRRLQGRAPIKFTLTACTVHPGFPEFSTEKIEGWLKENNVDYQVVMSTIYEKVFRDPVKAADGCFHCSRHRRSVLYRIADSLGCQKIALGHHRDDFVETVLLSMMYNSRIETMLPLFQSESKRFKVIRPLAYVAEKTTDEYALEKGFPISYCYCPLHGSGANLRRQKVKKMLNEIEREDPRIKSNIFWSLSNYSGSHMLDLRYNDGLKSLLKGRGVM